MTFSLLYTSRRPECIERVVALWANRAKDPRAFEFVFTADSDDLPTARAMASLAIRASRTGVKCLGPYSVPAPGSCVKGWNLAAEKSSMDVLIQVSDDFEPPVEWDLALKTFINAQPGLMLPTRFLDFAVLVNDGVMSANAESRLCMTLYVMSRARYEKFGYTSYPGYKSMFDDNENAERAELDGVLWRAPRLTFKHHHYVNQLRAKDAVDVIHASLERYEESARLFHARKSMGFPVDVGPCAPAPKVSPWRPVAYILTTGGEFCLAETVERLARCGVRDFYFSVPDKQWNGQPIPLIDRSHVLLLMEAMAVSGLNVMHQRLTVEKYTGARLMSDIEGRARNAALANLAELGFQHVLIVDDDEIWPKGLLELVRGMVERDNPAYIHADALPIVGVPGLPVAGAKDRVGVYIDATRNRFLSGRSPYKGGGLIGGCPVYHFTATRRSRDEVAAKMRSSAHYNDPDYAFEQWLRDTLPRVRVGARNLHMYLKGENVWPQARAWWPEEIEEIPATLHPYLQC